MSFSPPRRLSAEHRREQILQAAAELFVERGFEAVGMVEIAKALGTSRPTIYTYFSSTEQMLSELLTERLNQLPESIFPYLDYPLTEKGRLRALFLALLREKELILLLGSGGGPLFRAQREAFFSALEGRLRTYVIQQRHPSQKITQSLQQEMINNSILRIKLILRMLNTLCLFQITESDIKDEAMSDLVENLLLLGLENQLKKM